MPTYNAIGVDNRTATYLQLVEDYKVIDENTSSIRLQSNQWGVYNLSEENITKANKTISFTLEEILHNGNDWEDFCDKYGVNEYTVNEGGGHIQQEIFVNDAKKYGLI